MTIWIDAQLSPEITFWIEINFNVKANALRDLGLRDAKDEEIFIAAKNSNVVVITNDSGFISLFDKFDSPPKIIWLTAGILQTLISKLFCRKL